MSELNPQPLPPVAIRVQVSRDVLNDLEQFQKVQASILNKMGHPGCTSGVQITWEHYRDWVVDEAGNVRAVASAPVIGEAREG